MNWKVLVEFVTMTTISFDYCSVELCFGYLDFTNIAPLSLNSKYLRQQFIIYEALLRITAYWRTSMSSNPPTSESIQPGESGNLNLGPVQIQTVSGGQYRIDGGTLFGVVPRLLWERPFPADENHRILQETNCLLIESEGKKILVDTGYGSKLTERFRRHHEITQTDPLFSSLAKIGVQPEQIDQVILSHLHFDHAGGCTRKDEQGNLSVSFPNAEYVVQRQEWEIAMADLPELKGAYNRIDFELLEKTGQLRLVDGEAEVSAHIRVRRTGGHTQGHQAIFIEYEAEGAVYAGDICATRAHQPLAWCMAYDTNLLETRREKTKLLAEIRVKNWWLLLDHDPTTFALQLSEG